MKDNKTIIAAAQSISKRADVSANTEHHLQLIARAAQHQAGLRSFLRPDLILQSPSTHPFPSFSSSQKQP